jgi:MoxR-like ATPase
LQASCTKARHEPWNFGEDGEMTPAVNPAVGHVPEAPTLPSSGDGAGSAFDIADLYRGPVAGPVADGSGPPLDEKLRQAYFWIVNQAIISTHYDIEYQQGPNASFAFGDSKAVVDLPSGQSYSSFVLLPLLTFATRRRCLFVGGPGRGKTASAVLMGVLAGYSVRDVRRAMQHGHPQMTIADLLGSPLPADLLKAESADDIRIGWRSWLTMRVRIVDEYNRIPTRTQSALLTVLGDGYAEMYDQILECPDAAWFLTANDDGGGGTYPVIEALRDRIDVVVQALSFNSRFLGDLVDRVEQGYRPEEVVPAQIVFTPAELDQVHAEVLAVDLPVPVRRRLEHFAAQFEFLEPAAGQLEYMTKDTARLAGVDLHLLASAETGRDRLADIGAQTRNGLSVRALQTLIVYAKALAYFRGQRVVNLEDLRQVAPFVLRDKLLPDLDAPYFEFEGNRPLRVDRVAWIRRLFDLSCDDYDRLDLDHDDPVAAMQAEFERGLNGVAEGEVRTRLERIERLLAAWSTGRKLYGTVYDDILVLKHLHQRYTNYLAWLRWQGS